LAVNGVKIFVRLHVTLSVGTSVSQRLSSVLRILSCSSRQ